jgi:hypothetical protein
MSDLNKIVGAFPDMPDIIDPHKERDRRLAAVVEKFRHLDGILRGCVGEDSAPSYRVAVKKKQKTC